MARADKRPYSDRKLVQIVDTALLENASRCGQWLVCKPGCFQCCIGVFEISQLDAVRLREGLTELERRAPNRAIAVRKRAQDSRKRLAAGFPGDVKTGAVDSADKRFKKFGNDEPCPALDPKTGRCELYEYRPMTCRVFGPPVRTADGLGVCELCFAGAPEEVIAACELVADPDNLEARVTKEYEKRAGRSEKTLVAWALK